MASAALCEFGSPFLNGPQRSVNWNHAASTVEGRPGFGYNSVGPITSTRFEPALFNFESIVRRRHLSSRASARYSASYVFDQPSRSAIRQASSSNPLGRRGLISAAASRSNATAANSRVISLRQRNSCRTDDASAHMRWGATSSWRARGFRPTSERQAVMTADASMASTSAPGAGGTNRGKHVGHGFARLGLAPRGWEWQPSIARYTCQVVLVDEVLRANSGRSQPARSDPATHCFWVALRASRCLGYGEHCCLILQQPLNADTVTPVGKPWPTVLLSGIQRIQSVRLPSNWSRSCESPLGDHASDLPERTESNDSLAWTCAARHAAALG